MGVMEKDLTLVNIARGSDWKKSGITLFREWLNSILTSNHLQITSKSQPLQNSSPFFLTLTKFLLTKNLLSMKHEFTVFDIKLS